MKSSSPTRFMDVIDDLTVARILLFALAMTLFPSLIYQQLSANCPQGGCRNGLVEDDSPTISLSDALYFSVITETTVGYGDIRPKGWSRALACLQVISGLLIAGVSIAKVTTLRNRELRVAGRKAAGTWLVMNQVPEQDRIVTVTEITFDGRTIQYEGSNYTLQGDFCGIFTSELSDVIGHRIRFKYTNGESVTTHFSQGISTLQFDEQEGRWDHYSATAIDSGLNIKILFQGWRATAKQCERLHGADQRAVIQEFAGSFGYGKEKVSPKV